jgi:hypothetical protein
MVCDNSKEAKLNEEEMIMADTTIRCTWSAVTLVLPAIAPLRLVCRRDHYDIVSYELEPGDMLVHHHLTVHGSAGNATFRQTRRTASLRYCGDDIRFKFRPYAPAQAHFHHQLKDGDPLDCAQFPVVWPRPARLPAAA